MGEGLSWMSLRHRRHQGREGRHFSVSWIEAVSLGHGLLRVLTGMNMGTISILAYRAMIMVSAS
jgi:hypothetical protein